MGNNILSIVWFSMAKSAIKDPRKKKIQASGVSSSGAIKTKRRVGISAQKSAKIAILIGNRPELFLKIYHIKMADNPTNKENFSKLSGLRLSPLKSVNIKMTLGFIMKITVNIFVTSSAVEGVINQNAKPIIDQINQEIRLGFTVPLKILII